MKKATVVKAMDSADTQVGPYTVRQSIRGAAGKNGIVGG